MLNYINYGIEKPILISPYVGNIVELTTQYSNEICIFLEQEDVSAITYATMDIGNFIAKIKWLAINNAQDVTIAAIEKIYISRTSKLSKETLQKLRELKRELAKLLICVEDLPNSVRECIVHYLILTQSKINIVSNGYYYTIEPGVMLDLFVFPETIMRAVIRAVIS